jgi:hypothetical protein
MYELRYLVRPGWDGPEKVLQYRTQIEVTDYSRKTDDGIFLNAKKYTDWCDVPTVDETKNANIR